MAADADQAIQELISRLGLVGPQAESVARALLSAANATATLTNAKNAETDAIRGALSARDREDQALKTAAYTLKDFTTGIISTADSVAGAGGVMTSVTPALNFLSGTITKSAKVLPELGGILGTTIAGAFTGPMGMAAGGKIGTAIGEFLGGALEHLTEVVTTIATQYLEQGEKVIQAFNGLSTVGITFGGSMANMNRIITETNMPLEMLAKIAQQNAENLALLGGGTAGALERVAKAARNDLGPQLVTLYGGFANLSDELADYLAMEQRRGVSENLLSAENIEGTKAYLYQLKEISALTGKSSKQIKAEIEARSRNAATQGMLANMSRTQKDNFDKLMQTIPEGARAAMQDLVLAQSRGLEPISKAYLELEAVAPGITASMRDVAKDLGKSPEEFNKSLGKASADMATESAKLTQSMGDILYIKQAGYISASVIENLNNTLTDLNENKTRLKGVADDIKTFAEQTTALKNTTGGFVTSVNSIYAAQSNLAVKLNSLMIDEAGEKFSQFANLNVSITNTMSKAVDGLDKIVTAILEFNKDRTNVAQTQTGANRVAFTLESSKRDLVALESDKEQAILRGEDTSYFDEQIRIQRQQITNLENKLISATELAREAQRKREEQRDSFSLFGNSNQTPSSQSTNTQTNSDSNQSSISNADSARIFQSMAEYMQNQETMMKDLTTALNNQGGEIKRAVDKIPT
jgi:hypothetical protein